VNLKYARYLPSRDGSFAVLEFAPLPYVREDCPSVLAGPWKSVHTGLKRRQGVPAHRGQSAPLCLKKLLRVNLVGVGCASKDR
jgi:hypothetical protein